MSAMWLFASRPVLRNVQVSSPREGDCPVAVCPTWGHRSCSPASPHVSTAWRHPAADFATSGRRCNLVSEPMIRRAHPDFVEVGESDKDKQQWEVRFSSRAGLGRLCNDGSDGGTLLLLFHWLAVDSFLCQDSFRGEVRLALPCHLHAHTHAHNVHVTGQPAPVCQLSSSCPLPPLWPAAAGRLGAL